MKEIPLTKGMSAIVDDDDFEWLNQQKWFCSVAGSAKYAARESPRPNRKPIYMHREIMKTPEGMETDHINHNGLDNRKDNLRNCSHVDNEHNKGITRRNKSGYKGVSFYKKTGKWHA